MMKIFYSKLLDKIMHISQGGKIYQLDSLAKMLDIKDILESKYEVISVDKPLNSDLIGKFHTKEFVNALIHGVKREEFIESCGVFWQPYLPVAMSNRAIAFSVALENLLSNDNLSILIGDGGHHTTPFHAYGFGPINAVGIAIEDLLDKLNSKKVVILDLDVHQGNGFSYIEHPNVKIFDIWNKRLKKWEINTENKNYSNYKVETVNKWFDIYLKVLDEIVDYAPDIVIYYSGADVLETDRMGGIVDYTLDRFKEREDLLFNTLSKNNIKLCLTIGGGYIDYTKNNILLERSKLIDTHIYTIESAIDKLS